MQNYITVMLTKSETINAVLTLLSVTSTKLSLLIVFSVADHSGSCKITTICQIF